jgi:hypothetical protein
VLHPAGEAPCVRNLACQVGALPAFAEARPDAGSLSFGVGSTYAHGATHGVEHALPLYRTDSSVQALAARVALGACAVVLVRVEPGIGLRAENLAGAWELGAVDVALGVPEI